MFFDNIEEIEALKAAAIEREKALMAFETIAALLSVIYAAKSAIRKLADVFELEKHKDFNQCGLI